MTDQHGEIMSVLGELKGDQTATNQHLAQLNSKVASHEGRLNTMDVEDGKLGLIISALKEAQGKDSTLKEKWLDRGSVLVITVLLQLGLLLLVRSGVVHLETTPSTPEEISQKVVELQAEVLKLQGQIRVTQ